MCQPQPERTPMVMYERPEPTTLPPTSRGYIYNANCCSHCQSGIDKSDKVCSRCGAPNENYKQVVVEKRETWGEFIRQIENTEPSKILIDAEIDHEYSKASMAIEKQLMDLCFDNSDQANQKRLELESYKNQLKCLAFGYK